MNMHLCVVVVVLWISLNNVAFGLKLLPSFRLFSTQESSNAIRSATGGTDGAIPMPPTDLGKESAAKTEGSSFHMASILPSTFSAIGARNSTSRGAGRHFLSRTMCFPRIPRTLLPWRGSTALHHRLSPVVLPYFVERLQNVAECTPSVAARLSPYINPSFSFWMGLKVLQPSHGKAFISSAFKASMAMGTLCMARDIYVGGLGSRELAPRNDSYAVVTGAGDGIGREMSRQLFAHGYHLVLVDDSLQALQDVKNQLLDMSVLGSALVPARVFPKLQGHLQSLLLHLDTTKTASTPPVVDLNAKNTTLAEKTKTKRHRWWQLSNKNHANISTENTVISNSPVTTQEPLSIHLVETDYGKVTAPFTVLKELKKLNLEDKIEVLVNAAEHSRPTNFLSTPIQSLQRALHSNIHYTLTLTRLIAPLIIQRTAYSSIQLRNTQKSTPIISTHTNNVSNPVNVGNGRILFVDSMLATGPAPGHSVYAASKAFVSAFAQSLRRELLPQGVLVTVATLGAVHYPITYKQHREVSLSASAGDSVCTSTDRTESTGRVDLLSDTCEDSADGERESDAAAKRSAEVTTEELNSDVSQEDKAESEFLDAAPSTANVRVLTEAAVVPRKPLISFIPGCSMTGEQAGRAVFAALRAGRDATTPGVINKLYRYGFRALLPAPVHATLAQIALTPLPEWTLQRPMLPPKSKIFGFHLLPSLLQRDNSGSTMSNSGGVRVSANTCAAIATSILAQHLNSPIR